MNEALYSTVCVAGTFDGIHAGHEAMLRKAFAIGNRVLIGLTSDDYILHYKSPNSRISLISPYIRRKQALSRWLMAHDYLERASVTPIDDPYGPAVSDSSIDALVVSEETKSRGEEIVHMRKTPLTLIIIPMKKTTDGKKISSSDRLTLPGTLRNDLSKPLGRILSSFARPGLAKLIITVGDQTTKTALDAGIIPYLMIIDNKVERKEFFDLQPLLKKLPVIKYFVESGPGFISYEAKRLIESFPKGVIEVDGEEDLLVLPAIEAAPIDAIVYYGQPNRGVVEVMVTEEKKQEVKTLLEKFIL